MAQLIVNFEDSNKPVFDAMAKAHFKDELYGKDLAVAVFRALVVAGSLGYDFDSQGKCSHFTIKVTPTELESLDATDIEILHEVNWEVRDVQPVQEDPVG